MREREGEQMRKSERDKLLGTFKTSGTPAGGITSRNYIDENFWHYDNTNELVASESVHTK